MSTRSILIATLMVAACTERTTKTRAGGDDVQPDAAIAPRDPPPLRDAAAPVSVAFKHGFCGPGRMWIYPNAACGADAKPECVPVPPPMLAVHCGCDGVSYSLASAPWVHAGYCLGDAGAPGR